MGHRDIYLFSISILGRNELMKSLPVIGLFVYKTVLQITMVDGESSLRVLLHFPFQTLSNITYNLHVCSSQHNFPAIRGSACVSWQSADFYPVFLPHEWWQVWREHGLCPPPPSPHRSAESTIYTTPYWQRIEVWNNIFTSYIQEK